MTTSIQAPSVIPVLPESAPFTPSQRAWLNGFLAGMLNLQPASGGSAPFAAPTINTSAGASGEHHVSTSPAAPVEDEEMPWHDAALAMDERLALADGKPYARRLMAAMAQLDCGARGYLCKSYSEAIANGKEKDLTRCSPGGRETSKKLKELIAKEAASPTTVQVAVKGAPVAVAVPAAAPASAGPVTFGRHNPFPAKLLACEPLNKPGSMKDTRFVSLDLKGSGLTYKVGDALGVFPENDPDVVASVLGALNATGAEDVLSPDGPKVSLYDALHRHYSLGKPTDLMFELLINSATEPTEASVLKELLSGDGAPEGDEVLDLLKQFPSARPSAEEFVSALNPLQPRLYSMSSSLKAHPDQVHLTVGVVRYMNTKARPCKGVCSTFFADRVRPGQQARVFVHASHGFGVPSDGNVPIIMVGPGTGIAPFRAFLEERKATGAKGKNWLFFGDQQRAYDFLYEEQLSAWQSDGFLTRLDLAFSRDQKQKVYVQSKMLENAAEIWKWLQVGAHFYVCGDAKRMATDVDNALKQIVAEQGGMTPEAAKAYVSEMTKGKRYQRDVY